MVNSARHAARMNCVAVITHNLREHVDFWISNLALYLCQWPWQRWVVLGESFNYVVVITVVCGSTDQLSLIGLAIKCNSSLVLDIWRNSWTQLSKPNQNRAGLLIEKSLNETHCNYNWVTFTLLSVLSFCIALCQYVCNVTWWNRSQTRSKNVLWHITCLCNCCDVQVLHNPGGSIRGQSGWNPGSLQWGPPGNFRLNSQSLVSSISVLSSWGRSFSVSCSRCDYIHVLCCITHDWRNLQRVDFIKDHERTCSTRERLGPHTQHSLCATSESYI